jgi:glycopeptide antibiotics resistance protein
MMVDFGWMHIFVSLAALGIALMVLWMEGKSLSYLLFFSIFWIYLMGVVSLVAFPFPIGYPNPDFKPSVNLMPLNFGDCSYLILCIRNIYQNIILTVPLGFGVSFIAQIKYRNISWLALTVGLVFEVTQLVISLVARSPFRVVDINDVLLNALGVLLGYGIFRIFGWFYSVAIQKSQVQPRYVFAYIYDIVRHQN